MEIVEGKMYNCFHFLHGNTLIGHGKINFFFVILDCMFWKDGRI